MANNAEECIKQCNKITTLVASYGEDDLKPTVSKFHEHGVLIKIYKSDRPVLSVDIGLDGCIFSTILHDDTYTELQQKIKTVVECDCPTDTFTASWDSAVIADAKNISVVAFEDYLSMLETEDGTELSVVMSKVQEKLRREIPEMQQEIVHMLGHGKSVEYHSMLRRLTYAVSTVTSVLMLRFLSDTINELENAHETRPPDVGDSQPTGDVVPDAVGDPAEIDRVVESTVAGTESDGGNGESPETAVQVGIDVDSGGTSELSQGSDE